MENEAQLGFTTLEEELTLSELNITGKIPGWLSGTLIRDGFSKWEVGKENCRHWFDGFAMLHKFEFNDGCVSYSNKFLESEAYKKAMTSGQFTFSEFAIEPTDSYLGRVFLRLAQRFTDNAAVNVAKIGSSYVAMTETPLRVEYNPQTLETIGRFVYDDDVYGHFATAHPHIDSNGDLIEYLTKFTTSSTYNLYRIKAGSKKRKLIASLPIEEPVYYHSFSITENYIIIAEFPLVLNPLKLIFSGKPLIDILTWKPEKGTRFLVIDKHNGNLVGTYISETCFGYHHINAFEKEGEIIVDLIIYKDSQIVDAGYLERFKSGIYTMPIPELRRYHLYLNTTHITYDLLSTDFVEFPRINYNKYNGKEYSFIYGMSSNNSSGFLNHLKKIDILKKNSKMWYEEGCYAGEPVFVEAPHATEEDDGVVLSVVLDTNNKNAFLLVLDAQSFNELARVEVPHHIPFGAHGQYYENLH